MAMEENVLTLYKHTMKQISKETYYLLLTLNRLRINNSHTNITIYISLFTSLYLSRGKERDKRVKQEQLMDLIKCIWKQFILFLQTFYNLKFYQNENSKNILVITYPSLSYHLTISALSSSRITQPTMCSPDSIRFSPLFPLPQIPYAFSAHLKPHKTQANGHYFWKSSRISLAGLLALLRLN